MRPRFTKPFPLAPYAQYQHSPKTWKHALDGCRSVQKLDYNRSSRGSIGWRCQPNRILIAVSRSESLENSPKSQNWQPSAVHASRIPTVHPQGHGCRSSSTRHETRKPVRSQPFTHSPLAATGSLTLSSIPSAPSPPARSRSGSPTSRCPSPPLSGSGTGVLGTSDEANPSTERLHRPDYKLSRGTVRFLAPYPMIPTKFTPTIKS